MTVGEAIADARGAAGLSVDEVSERTRIRETVIRSIERDDFEALGGDLYVRGYLRAIAGAVGIDAQPLIREFDASRGSGSGGWPTIATTRPAAGPMAPQPVADGQAAAEPAADGPVAEEPLADGPAVGGPAVDGPAVGGPAVGESVADERAVGGSVADVPTAEEPVADEPATAQSAGDSPAADGATADAGSAADGRVAEGPVAADSVAEGPVAEGPVAGELAAAEPVTGGPVAAESEAARPASTEPAVTGPADGQAPAAEAAGAEPPAVMPAGFDGEHAGDPDGAGWLASGDHPTTVDEIPVYVDHPTTVDEIPLYVDEPTIASRPVTADSPAGPGKPVVDDQPTLADQPVIDDQPTLADNPVIADPPTLVDIPVIGDAPAHADSGGSPPWSPAAWNPGADDYFPFWADDAVSDADPAPVGKPAFDEPTVALGTGSSAPAGAAVPGTRSAPARTGPPRGPRSRVRGWRWAAGITALVIAVLGIVGIASGQIVAKLRHTTAASATTAPAAPARTTAVATPSPTPTPVPTTPSPSPKPKPKPTAVSARALAVRSATAYGPGGTGDGDHPEKARNVLVSGTGDPWQTDWYASAKFGMLKTGTGLLLDMGHPVTITSLRIRLDSTPGTSLQIRVGNSTAFSETTVKATAQNTGGTLNLHFSKPARARYVVIWFTRLPPSGAGQFRETVYSVAVTGRP